MNFIDIPLFLKAMLVGLSIAAPVGPIGLLTIQRTLQRGMPAGLATGLGAAAADAVYGAVGAFGVTSVVAALTSARVPLSLVGGALLLWWQRGYLCGLIMAEAKPCCIAAKRGLCISLAECERQRSPASMGSQMHPDV